ncbi:MAG: HIT domain-containing protein [Candidatus Omnitrophota bacterium]
MAGVVAFEDINPKAPVHIIIIPERHIERISDASRSFRRQEICPAARIKERTCQRNRPKEVPSGSEWKKENIQG